MHGVLAAAVTLLAAGGPVASANARADGLVRIVSPQANAIATGSSVPVVVRLAPGVRSFRATVDGRPVTRRFATAPETRKARLRLARGRHAIHVWVRGRSGRRAFAARDLLVAQRDKRMLSVSFRPVARAAGSVRLRVRVRREAAAVRLWLNGRRVDGALPSRGRVRSAVLAGDQGLRFGRNRLKALASVPRGVYDVARSRVTVRRTKPIPAAGPDRRALVDRRVRLDGRASRAPGGRLRYRWSIVRRPRAAASARATASAQLQNVTSPTPVLIPRAPGAYTIQLVVTDTASGTTASDLVTVEAAPDAAPLGVPVNTLDTSGSGAQITLGAPIDASFAPQVPTDAVQLLVLDRSTLAVASNTSYPGGEQGMQALLGAVTNAGNDSIAIITTPTRGAVAPAPTAAALGYLVRALALIGAPTIDVSTSLTTFSAIGTPGSGTGNLNPGLSLATPGSDAAAAGALHGYLQVDDQRNFTYVAPDYASFDTVADGTTPTQAVIEVGGQRYGSSAVSTPGGFFVLVLDAGTLAHRADGTFPIVGGRGADQASLTSMNALLTQYAGDRSALVFTQSIGTVTRNDGPAAGVWNQVATTEQRLGSHYLLFDALPYGGKGDYARVGPGAREPGYGLSQWAKTESFAATRAPGRLTGTLSRNPRSQYYPSLAGPLQQVSDNIPAVAYQPPTTGALPCPDTGGPSAPGAAWSTAQSTWPCRDTPARNAALACIGQALDLTLPIERNYWFSGGVVWSDKLTVLESLSYGSLPTFPSCNTTDFAAADFGAVKQQLVAEFQAVDAVLDLIGHLEEPLTVSSTVDYADLEQIAAQIQASVKPPPSASVSFNPLDIVGGLLDIASEVSGEELGPVLGIWGASLFLAADVTDKPDGSEVVDTQIQTTATALGQQLETSYVAANGQLDHVGDILVSDWGKLQAAAANAGSGGSWNWAPGTTGAVVDGLMVSTQQQAYEQLFPLAYTLYSLVDNTIPDPGAPPGARGPGASVPSSAQQLQCAKTGFVPPFHRMSYNVFAPFRKAPSSGQFHAVVAAGPQMALWAFGRGDHYFLNGTKAPSYVGTPPAALTTDMFGAAPPDPSAPLGPVRYAVDVGAPRGIPVITNNGPPRKIANEVDGGTRLFGVYCTVNGRP